MSRSIPQIRSLALALLAAATCSVTSATAAVFIPTTTAGTSDGVCDADCSLRDAVLAANLADGPDVIVLRAGTYTLGNPGAGEDFGATGDLDIRDDLSIVGESAESTILRGNEDRVLDVQAGVSLELVDLSIRDSFALGDGGGIRNAGALTLSRVWVTNNTAGSGSGGGIYSQGPNASLTVSQSAVTSNTATISGGGIAVGTQFALTDSTISGNVANNRGGGVHVFENTVAPIVGATITNNRAGSEGGGLFVESTPFITEFHATLHNTILAGNTAPTYRDCGGSPTSEGQNVVGSPGYCIDLSAPRGDVVGTDAAPLNPRVGPLANNGGTTPTHALLAGSPALGAGQDCTATDQRGQSRQEATCDAGAFEQGTACLTGGPTLCLNNDRFRVTAAWRTGTGQTGTGTAVQLTADTGYFWFFDPANVEMTIKVLNGCGVNGRYWAFLSGMTDVQVTTTVTDTVTGQTRTYNSPLGQTFKTTLDTSAFAVCGG